MSKPRPLILDCDPGIDDFVAILMILAAPEKFNLLGITVTGGNVPLKYTIQNTLKACELAGRPDVKVYAGCPAAMMRSHAYESDVHGETGLKGPELPTPTMKAQPQHAVDFLIDALMTSKEKVLLATTGPLTNIAVAIIREPRILDHIDEIVTMGGSMELGNITPAAEFNFYADPEAVRILLTSRKLPTLVGLDVTHHVLTTHDWFEELEALDNPVAQTLVAMLRAFYDYDVQTYGLTGGALHDPAVIAYLLKPDLFKGQNVHVEVDLSFNVTRGRSTVDWYDKRHLEKNAHVLNKIDIKGFFTLLTDLLSRYDTSPLSQLTKGLS